MRCQNFLALIVLGLSSGSAPANAGDSDFMRWIGLGWGPGYHAYNNCGQNGQCGGGCGGGTNVYGVSSPPMNYRPAAPALRPTEAVPAPPPVQPKPTPQLTPPLKPSEEAARAGRYLLPSNEYKPPTYVGQRYPRLAY